MRHVYTIMLAVLLGGIAVQAQEADYQPLVREGVVWHYAYLKMNVENVPELGSSLIDCKVQFKGDTLVNGIGYKKCYFYETESLEDYTKPVALAREVDGAVMFAKTDAYIWSNDESFEYALVSSTLPGEHDERIVYDFADMSGFVARLKSQNQADAQLDLELVATDRVSVADNTVNKYTLTGSFMYPNSYYVESVGVDGYLSGYLFMPLVDLLTCYCSRSIGLIKLTDLEGKMLYKGTNYDEYYSAVDKLQSNQQMRVVQQPDGALHAVLPSDGMLSVFDMAGHMVACRLVTQGINEFSTSSLAAGIYLVQLSTATGTHTAKVVVK